MQAVKTDGSCNIMQYLLQIKTLYTACNLRIVRKSHQKIDYIYTVYSYLSSNGNVIYTYALSFCYA